MAFESLAVQRYSGRPRFGSNRTYYYNYDYRPYSYQSYETPSVVRIGLCGLLVSMCLGTMSFIYGSAQGLRGNHIFWNDHSTLSKPQKLTWMERAEQQSKVPIEESTNRLRANCRFKHYSVKNGKFVWVLPGEGWKQYEDIILKRFVLLLSQRPMLLNSFINRRMEISLYDSNGFVYSGTNGQTSGGGAEPNGNFDFALGCLRDTNDLKDNFEIMGHELTHQLDNSDKWGNVRYSFNGLLPQWTPEEVEAFKEARTEEKVKIANKQSPICAYALENDNEFLATLAEAYFERPVELKKSNQVLYQLMDNAFGHQIAEYKEQENQEAQAYANSLTFSPTPTLYLLGTAGALFVCSLGVMLIRPEGRKYFSDQYP